MPLTSSLVPAAPASQRPWTSRRLAEDQCSELVIASADGKSISVIYETGELIEAPNWTPDGQALIYNGDGRLYRMSVDGRQGPQRINTAPVENLNNDHVLSPDGRLIYLSSNDGHLYRVSIDGGAPQRVSSDKEPGRGFRHYLHGMSPDGASLAYVGLERQGEGIVTRICTQPAAGGPDLFLTDGRAAVDGPDYSADGQWIYYNSEEAASIPGHAQIFRIRPDGRDRQQLTFDERVNWFPHPAPDGHACVYLSYPPGTRGHPADCDVIVRMMDMEGGESRDIDRFNGGQGTINVPSWAPDSAAFAYVRYPRRKK